MIRYDMLQLF